jgi:hypothetical protein
VEVDMAKRLSVSVKDTDKGMKKIIASLRSTERKQLTVGVHKEAGYHKNEGVLTQDGRSLGDFKLTVAQVGWIQELGTDRIPKRPFMTTAFNWFVRDTNDWVDYFKSLVKDVNTVGDMQMAIQLTGMQVAEEIQGVIERYNDPANNMEYVQRQKPEIGNNPLIHTRQLKNAIKGKVTNV